MSFNPSVSVDSNGGCLLGIWGNERGRACLEKYIGLGHNFVLYGDTGSEITWTNEIIIGLGETRRFRR